MTCIYFKVPKTGWNPKQVFDERVQVVSDPVGQAVESLHPADGMFHGDPGSRMVAVML